MRKSAATGHPSYYGGPTGPRHCSPGTHPTAQGSFPAHGSHFGGAGPWSGHGSASSTGFYPSPHEPYASSSQLAYSGYHGSQQASLNSSAAFYGFHPPNTPSLYNRFENFQYPSAGPQSCKEPSAGPKSQKEASTAEHGAASSSDSIEVPSAPPKRAQTQVKSRSSKPKSSKSSSLIGHDTCRADKEIATRRKRGRPFKKPPSLKSRKPVVLPSPPRSSPLEAEPEETTKTVLKPTARRRPAEKPKRQKPKKSVSARVTSEPEVKAPASALSRSSKRTVTEYEEFQEIEEQAKKMRVLSPSKRKARARSHVKLPTVLTHTQSSGQIKKFTKKIVLGAAPAATQTASEDPLPGTSVRPTTQPTAGIVKNLKSAEVVGVVSCTDCREVKKVLQDVQVKLEKLEVTVDTLKVNKSTPPRRPSTPLVDLSVGDEFVDDFPKSNENTQPGEMDLDECPVSNNTSQMNDEVHSITSDSSDYVDADIDAEQTSDREVSLDRM